MRSKVILLTAIISLFFSTASFAQVEEDARKIIDANKEAVVSAQLVIEAKMTYQGQSEKAEHKVTASGTIIDPSGLMVSSLWETNPGSYAEDALGDKGYNYSTEIKDIRIRLTDGTEIPADIVLRDPDLDLIFMKPKSKSDKPFPYVDLSKASSPQVLDQVIVLSRLGPIVNHSLGACIDRIQSVVSKPRTFYIVNSNIHDYLGVPAFTIDGKCSGILLTRSTKHGPDDDESDSYTIILPCSTVLNAAQQAMKVPAAK
jgi:hypothetical protein